MRSLRTPPGRGARGSATVELVLMVPLVISLLFFVVYCGRLADTRLRLEDAAHQAVRAATQARTSTQAAADARTTADAALREAGIACRTFTVTTDPKGLAPGATARVTMSCTVGLEDLALLQLPGTTGLKAESAAVIDVYRGRG